MGVKERLQEFLKAERISASEFSRKMGLSPAYLASMRKSMPPEKVERLIELFPQLNRDWLIYGEGSMYRDMGDNIDPHLLHRRMVPLVPVRANAGSLDSYAHGVMREECEKIYSPIDGAEIAIKVQGDSMEPRIQNGAFLFLERINDRAFIPWGKAMVLDTTNGTLVKSLYPSEEGKEYVEARSYNPAYLPIQIPKETIIGIYRIMAMITEGDSF